MNFENIGIQLFKADLNRLDDIMKKYGMIHLQRSI